MVTRDAPPQVRMYAAVGSDGIFHFEDLYRSKKSVRITGSDRIYGGASVQTITMRLRTPADQSPAVTGWLVLNPDNTWWMDSLSATEAESASWMTDRARMEVIGFKLVEVVFTLKKSVALHD